MLICTLIKAHLCSGKPCRNMAEIAEIRLQWLTLNNYWRHLQNSLWTCQLIYMYRIGAVQTKLLLPTSTTTIDKSSIEWVWQMPRQKLDPGSAGSDFPLTGYLQGISKPAERCTLFSISWVCPRASLQHNMIKTTQIGGTLEASLSDAQTTLTDSFQCGGIEAPLWLIHKCQAPRPIFCHFSLSILCSSLSSLMNKTSNGPPGIPWPQNLRC